MAHLRNMFLSECSTSGRTERILLQRPLMQQCPDRWRGSKSLRTTVCSAGSYAQNGPGQQVVALTWEEAVRMQQQQQQDTEEWWSESAESTARPRAATVAESVVRPLKINLDLLLVRAHPLYPYWSCRALC